LVKVKFIALVIDIHQNKPALYDAKEIHQILEEQPIVTETQIAHGNGLLPIICVPLAMYMSYTECAFVESETVISKNEYYCRY
jgi:primosomal protein N' (replication factor Y)